MSACWEFGLPTLSTLKSTKQNIASCTPCWSGGPKEDSILLWSFGSTPQMPNVLLIMKKQSRTGQEAEEEATAEAEEVE